MTANDRKYTARTITLPADVAKLLEEYQRQVEEEFGAKMPYHLAIAIAIKRAKAK
jgi:hypothetical protein